MAQKEKILPLGKLPPALLEAMISRAPIQDPRVLLGPGVGLDCAVLDLGATLLVFKTEPITFVVDQIGWYAVTIAANDIATTGAEPRWYLATLLLPEGHTTPELVEQITAQAYNACQEMGISVIGGHTEITHGINRPLLIGTLIGEVDRSKLITPKGASPGDHVLLTKGVPIEATAILAREFPERLRSVLTEQELEQARDFLYDPGVSIQRDARISVQAGKVTAMHDPTEGGLTAALWEMAQASGHTFIVHLERIPVPVLSARICSVFGLDPLSTIASGALLLTAPEEDSQTIRLALEENGIACADIGRVEEGPAEVWSETPGGRDAVTRPQRDEITKVYERAI